MPTFLELMYKGNYVKHGRLNRYNCVFTYKGEVYLVFHHELVVNLRQAIGCFDFSGDRQTVTSGHESPSMDNSGVA